MTEKPDQKQLDLPLANAERLPPRAAAKKSVKDVKSAVKALRAAKHRRENQLDVQVRKTR